MILVDAGLPLFATVIEHYMEQIGRDDLKLIYITHAHIDHYGSAAEMRRRTGAPIAIHADDAESMAVGTTELGVVRDWIWISKKALPFLEPMLTVEPTEPDIILHDGDRLDEYGVPATVVHTPGHTPGSSTLMVDGGVAFVGDLLSASGEDHVQQSYAHNWIQIGESLKKLATYHPQVLYTGHGDNAITAETLHELTEAYLKEKGIEQ
jgi:glyoxylase-like metal-dependent hydrolase (beta-lactamase superfamily II)